MEIRAACVEDIAAPLLRQRRDVALRPMHRGIINYLDPVPNLRQMRNQA